MRRTRTVATVIPAWEPDPDRLRMTLASARRARSDEIVIVDDGSVGGMIHLDQLAGGDVSVVRLDSRSGIAAALNAGIKAASAELVCWLSVGDLMFADKIDHQLEAMERAGALASFTEHASQRRAPNLDRLASDNQFCGSTTMVHRGVALIFPLDSSLRYCVDWDWSCRIHFDGPGWLHVPETLGDGREYHDGHTRTAPRADRARDRAEVSRRWRRRRRGDRE